MKALVYKGPEKAEVCDVPQATLLPGQARIKVSYCGVCGSDIGIYSGKHPRAKAPLIMGHEFVGVIEETMGETGGFKPGDRVAAFPLISCGKCLPCRTGRSHICNSLKLIGIDLDGGMAQYVNCSSDVLFLLPDNVDDRICSIIEPLAVAVHSVHRSGFRPLDTCAVIGAGPIGLLVGIVLKDSGASRVIISDISQPRLDLCRELGFETVNSREQSLADYVMEATSGDGANVVYECSGAAAGAAEMTYPVCADGMITLVGVHKEPRQVVLGDMHFRELNMTATRVYTKEEFGQTVRYTQKLKHELDKVITHAVPLEESERVFDIIADPAEKAMKVVIKCN